MGLADSSRTPDNGTKEPEINAPSRIFGRVLESPRTPVPTQNSTERTTSINRPVGRVGWFRTDLSRSDAIPRFRSLDHVGFNSDTERDPDR